MKRILLTIRTILFIGWSTLPTFLYDYTILVLFLVFLCRDLFSFGTQWLHRERKLLHKEVEKISNKSVVREIVHEITNHTALTIYNGIQYLFSAFNKEVSNDVSSGNNEETKKTIFFEIAVVYRKLLKVFPFTFFSLPFVCFRIFFRLVCITNDSALVFILVSVGTSMCLGYLCNAFFQGEIGIRMIVFCLNQWNLLSKYVNVGNLVNILFTCYFVVSNLSPFFLYEYETDNDGMYIVQFIVTSFIVCADSFYKHEYIGIMQMEKKLRLHTITESGNTFDRFRIIIASIAIVVSFVDICGILSSNFLNSLTFYFVIKYGFLSIWSRIDWFGLCNYVVNVLVLNKEYSNDEDCFDMFEKIYRYCSESEGETISLQDLMDFVDSKKDCILQYVTFVICIGTRLIEITKIPDDIHSSEKVTSLIEYIFPRANKLKECKQGLGKFYGIKNTYENKFLVNTVSGMATKCFSLF
jgi:hypothetical protein